MSNGMVPDRIIFTMIKTGVDAIVADLGVSAAGSTVLDDILSPSVPADEVTKARALWASNPPVVRFGYARAETPMPCYAITLAGDDPSQDFLAFGEEDELGVSDEVIGAGYRTLTNARFSLLVYATHPDICSWNYRVLRRICNVGRTYMRQQDLDDPLLSGADLAPDPRYTPDNLFVRRLMLTVEYEERWSDQDALWQALNGTPEARGTSVRVHREDIEEPENNFGGVSTYTPDE